MVVVSSSSNRNGARSVTALSRPAPQGTPPDIQLNWRLARPSSAPGNELTLLRAELVHSLGVKDPRNNLRIFGLFIPELPQRLGMNEALDASTGLLVATCENLFSKSTCLDLLRRQGAALQALRRCLVDPDEAASVETIIAIYFIMSCQSMVGKVDELYVGHGRILAHLMESQMPENNLDGFKLNVLSTIASTLIGFGMLHTSIRLSPGVRKLRERWSSLEPIDSDQATRGFVKLIPTLAENGDAVSYPEAHYTTIRKKYASSRQVIQNFRQLVAKAEEKGEVSALLGTLPAAYDTALAFTVAECCVWNSILSAFHPDDEALPLEAAAMREHLLALGRQIAQHRPLGSMHTQFLIASALTTRSAAREAELRALLDDLGSDFPLAHWPEITAWLRRKLERLRLKVERNGLEAVADKPMCALVLDPIELPEDTPPPGTCCVM